MSWRPLAALRALHAEVDARAGALATRQAERLHCRRGCSACCVDDLRVFAIEAERIRAGHAELLARGEPHAPGACAFLDGAGACRIYADRPYVCRTQGLPLRWLDESARAELRDICPLNETGPPLESLPEDDCFTLGPFEARLAALQAEHGAPGARVALRALFRVTAAGYVPEVSTRIRPARVVRAGEVTPASEVRALSPAERVDMMWQLACDAWAFRGEPIDESRLPRHVVRVERRGR